MSDAPFPDARQLLDTYGLRAKKWFGQNFLINERVFRAIVGAPGLGPFRMVRTPIAVLIGVFTVPIGLFGSFILHRAMTFDGDRSHDEDVDWDWD